MARLTIRFLIMALCFTWVPLSHHSMYCVWFVGWSLGRCPNSYFVSLKHHAYTVIPTLPWAFVCRDAECGRRVSDGCAPRITMVVSRLGLWIGIEPAYIPGKRRHQHFIISHRTPAYFKTRQLVNDLLCGLSTSSFLFADDVKQVALRNDWQSNVRVSIAHLLHPFRVSRA